MSTHEIQEALKRMSGEELAQAQNSIILATDARPKERRAALSLVSQEIEMRQTEGLGRKAERLWNRHGEKVAMLAIGALVGDWVGD